MCGSQQSHYSLKKFGLVEVWTQVSQLTHQRSIHFSHRRQVYLAIVPEGNEEINGVANNTDEPDVQAQEVWDLFLEKNRIRFLKQNFVPELAMSGLSWFVYLL
jgi:hypothetical protein